MTYSSVLDKNMIYYTMFTTIECNRYMKSFSPCIYAEEIEIHAHHATKVMHRKIWCETYKLYMSVFNEIYNLGSFIKY